MRIITNADDLGISRDVNQAVFDLMAQGLITSSTIRANGPAFSDACRHLRQFPRCSFGVHLNLTEFRPLSPDACLGPLVDSSGEYNGKIRQINGLLRLQRGIFEELCRQTDLITSSGVNISHFDSHHHVHTIPALFPVLKSLQRRCGMRKVRLSLNVYRRDAEPGTVFLIKKYLFNTALRCYFRTRTTEAFADLVSFRQKEELLRRKYRTLEIMLHPGAGGSVEETRSLFAAGRENSFRSCLISYNEL